MTKRHILALAVIAALTGCSGGDDAATGDAAKSMVEKAAEGAKEVAGKAVDSAKEAASAVADGTKDMATAAADATKEAAGAAVEKAKEVAGGAVEKAKEAAGGAVEQAKDAAGGAAAAAKGAVAAATGGGADGAKLYMACAGCHGPQGDMKALNVSPPLKGQSKEELAKKIRGYKDGSFGGPMKGVMATQVTNLSDADIEAVAEYISKF